MIKNYFTFGQNHIHRVNGKTFDADCVVEIEAETPEEARDKMFCYFGRKWAFQYDDLEKVGLHYYSRGVIPLIGNNANTSF